MIRKGIALIILLLFIGIIINPIICGTNRNIKTSINQSGVKSIEEHHLTTDLLLNDEWNRTYGGNKTDRGYSVQQTSDDGFIIVGETKSYSKGEDDKDLWLLKTDKNGNEQWNKTIGGTETDLGRSFQQTSDGGYILTGYTNSFDSGKGDVWLIKIDSYGNEEWNKTFGGREADSGVSIQQTYDDGYIIVGYTFSYAKGDAWVIKTDTNGNEEWNTTCGIYGCGFSIDKTDDGGYIICGEVYESSSFDDIFLIKLDANGNELWNKTFGGIGYEHGYGVQQTSDGGYILIGSTGTYNITLYDVWLIKTDVDVNEEWNKTFDKGNLDIGYSIEQTKDGGYIIVGITAEPPFYRSDTWLLKTDSMGNKVWDMLFGGPDDEKGRVVRQTKDDGYIITGWQGPYDGLNYDAWLVKVGAFENQRPNQPVINGTIKGKTNRIYDYTIVSTDPDNDDIYYFIDWDNKETETIGPFPSGINVTVNHSWHDKGNYTIKVMTIDIHGGESDWAILEVMIPKNKSLNFNINLLKWLFDRFPHKFPILKFILNQ